MELTHEFTVGIPVDDAWEVLTDVERIAPCLPGAQLQEVVGDEYRGTVKVKVGPVSAEYRGSATFVEQDAVAHRAVLRAQGREARGQGSARADITATLLPVSGATTVKVVTDLTVSGRVAQFGRGVLADVSARLLDEFAACLESTVMTGADAGPSVTPDAAVSSSTPEPGSGTERAGAGTTAAEPGVQPRPGAGTAEAPERAEAPAASVDLVRVAGPAVAKRVLPVVIATVVLWLMWRGVRRRRTRARAG